MKKVARIKEVKKHSAIELGIPDKQRKNIASGLSMVLADSYMLYIKTHNFHWNVEGPMFSTLHNLFMVQYTELWNSLDLIAERIRALGEYAPGTYKQFAKLTSIEESDKIPKADHMILELLKGHETVAQTVRRLFPIAEDGEDQATMDLLTQRLQLHEKTAWMLRSLLS
ncbi:MAG: DNA starvation/stationary phase protection protein [Bdellovibrionales bacterium RIFCSPHIGHO2_01_FULL_40_29]|nr:MAG: DNA starvation/stationary phase protection protein [Bdellovibrionales bacterium RIFCSPHIGHO2_01_FULL_40_29]OFZ34464.1 MAG: DNA starvation/stationary phase protection protein [Bdellovibrionales bacterium RIFCSPHIGHO2_02_FULL_40_15]